MSERCGRGKLNGGAGVFDQRYGLIEDIYGGNAPAHREYSRPLYECRCWNNVASGVCTVPRHFLRGPGLMEQRHGEVFVLDDGGEVDLDLGN